MARPITPPVCAKCGTQKKQRPSGEWRCNLYACRTGKFDPADAANDDHVDPLVQAVKRANEQQAESQLRKEHKALVADKLRLEAELEAALGLKGFKPARITPSGATSSGESIAVVIGSDWHLEETVNPETISGLNEYNQDIARKRASLFFENSLRLTDMMCRDTDIRTIHFAALGDFITGWLHEENREVNSLPPVHAARMALEVLAGGIDFWLKESPYDLDINCMNGNHERLTRQTRGANRVGTSLGSMVYWALQARYLGNPRVSIAVPETNVAYVEFFGGKYRVRETHGDEINCGGGIGGITIPINKKIAAWDVAIQAYLTFIAHFHQLTFGSRAVINGSGIGYNSYAQTIGASPERAQQAFLLLNEKYGRTVCAPILLETVGTPDIQEAA